MSIFTKLDKVGKDIERDVEAFGDEIEKALKQATETVISGLEKVKTLVEKEFGVLEQELMQQAAKAVLTEYGDAISALRTLATQGIASANAQSIINDVVAAFKNGDGSAAKAVLGNLTTTTMQQAYADFSQFTTLTLYSDDEIDLGFGVAAAAGAGMQMPGTDPSQSRMLMDFEATAGAEEGADLGLALGIWRDTPQGIQEKYLRKGNLPLCRRWDSRP
jgi:hypothetical protein